MEEREFEWVKIEVGTGAGKTAWPQSVTHGKRIPGDVDLTFRTVTGKLVKRLYVESCDDWGVNLRVRGVQAPVCKPLLPVGGYTTMGDVAVMYGDKRLPCSTRARMLRRNLKNEICRKTILTVVQLRTRKTTCTTST